MFQNDVIHIFRLISKYMLFNLVTSCKSDMQYLFLTTLFLYATKQVVLQILWLFILDLYIRPSLGVYYGPFMDGIVHNCN